MIRTALFAFLSLMLLSATALAFKPAPPKAVQIVRDASKSVTLTMTHRGYSVHTITLNDGKTTRTWSGSYEIASRVFIAKNAARVLFLGGYGDACSSLGEVKIYDFAGVLQTTIDLRKSIGNLRQLSKAFTPICCPCRWIGGVREGQTGKTAVIDICHKKSVTLDLVRSSVTSVKALP
ncbi:MAG: hypothetical protein KC609_05100 [Myxococcales bacterium]|nr:hypothetical protein [Myxococcales bacterium]